jgi:hypothetical protein
VALLRDVLDRAQAGWFPALPGEECCSRSLHLACGPQAGARFHGKRRDPDVARRLALLAEPDREEPR